MFGASMDNDSLFDLDAYCRSGDFPWTFFAFPTSLADEYGLPPDDDAQRLLAELHSRGIRVGIWANAMAEDTTYFACPKEDIERVNCALTELEDDGAFENDFCANRSEHLFSMLRPGT